MTPIRIQRKRVKGFKLPPNTICVTRGTEFGNPFKIGGWYKIGSGKRAGEFMWIQCYDKFDAEREGYIEADTVEKALEMYRTMLERYPFSDDKIEKLRGKNLACFCKEGSPCHADILLEIANPKP